MNDAEASTMAAISPASTGHPLAWSSAATVVLAGVGIHLGTAAP
jgi:hypothetical protein